MMASSSMNTHHSHRPRRLGVLLAVVALVAMAAPVLTGLPGHETAAHADSGSAMSSDAYFTLSLSTPTQNLVNGQSMQFTVNRTAAGTAAG